MKDFLEILPSDPIGCEYDQFAYVTTLFFICPAISNYQSGASSDSQTHQLGR